VKEASMMVVVGADAQKRTQNGAVRQLGRRQPSLSAAAPDASSTPPADAVTIRLIIMQHIAIHGPRPRPDARDHESLSNTSDIMAR
jgi:hypothetical protein